MLTTDSFLFIHGAGGHAKSIGDAAFFRNIFFVDPYVDPQKKYHKGELIQALPFPQENHFHIVGLGDNEKRQRLFLELKAQGHIFTTICATGAKISELTTIKTGCFIAHGAYVGIDAVIDENSIINTYAVIEHDVEIGAHTHIAINACIAGSAKIGENCFIGANATVIDGITITDHVTIGAGATVIQNILEPGVYVGTPAKKIK